MNNQHLIDDLHQLASRWLASEDETLTPSTASAPTSRQFTGKAPGKIAHISWRHGVSILRRFAFHGSYKDKEGNEHEYTHHSLWVYAATIADDLNMRQPPNNVEGLCNWLINALNSDDIDPNLLAGVEEEVRKLLPQGKFHAGEAERTGMRIPCPTEQEDGTKCKGKLPVKDLNMHSDKTRCNKCGQERSNAFIVRHAAERALDDPDMLVPLEIATRVTGIPTSTLERWARQGKIRRRRGRYSAYDAQLNQQRAS